MGTDGAWPHDLVDRLRSGETAAADEIVDVYTQRLLALARSKVSRRYRRRFDPEDVVQSAFSIFFAMTRSEKIVLERQGDLWRLLSTLTINKVRNRIHHNRAAKRDVSDEESYRGALPEPHDRGPGPDDVAVLEDEIRSVRHSLQPDHHFIFNSLLVGSTAAEIAAESGCSERTVQRVAAEVREKLEIRLGLRATAGPDDAVEPSTPVRNRDAGPSPEG
jgi:DNA-directed RNA polymerase specialized sigma24 family protein